MKKNSVSIIIGYKDENWKFEIFDSLDPTRNSTWPSGSISWTGFNAIMTMGDFNKTWQPTINLYFTKFFVCRLLVT